MSLTARFLALPAMFLFASVATGTGLKPGGPSEFSVELPQELRQIAARGGPSPVAHALVTVAVPENFDATRSYPVMVISATSDPQYHSSRRLLGTYAEMAIAGGWILVAADPGEEVSVERDDVNLRYALTPRRLPHWSRNGRRAARSHWLSVASLGARNSRAGLLQPSRVKAARSSGFTLPASTLTRSYPRPVISAY